MDREQERLNRVEERKQRLREQHEKRLEVLRERAQRQSARTLHPRNGNLGLGRHVAKGSQGVRSVPQRKHDPKRDGYVWAYGVTTYLPNDGERQVRPVRSLVPNRSGDLLPRTLESLSKGGFPNPYLFVDNAYDPTPWRESFPSCHVVCRYPRVRALGNWLLGLGELMVREPFADYYAMFQDDMVTSINLRSYLETVVYPDKGYLNLYTFPKNQSLAQGRVGFYPAVQKGYGAVALVFSREAAVAVISDPHLTNKTAALDITRRHKFIDGGVIEAMRKQGWTEYVHNPSLVQHTGSLSTIANRHHPVAQSFMGEGFDCMTLFEGTTDVPADAQRKKPEPTRRSSQEASRVETVPDPDRGGSGTRSQDDRGNGQQSGGVARSPVRLSEAARQAQQVVRSRMDVPTRGADDDTSEGGT